MRYISFFVGCFILFVIGLIVFNTNLKHIGFDADERWSIWIMVVIGLILYFVGKWRIMKDN